MKTYLDCYPCFLRQALDAARLAGADDEQQKVVLNHAMQVLRDLDLASTPPEISDSIHRAVRQIAHGDPYREAKDASTRQALALYPRLTELVAESSDPLDTAIRLSIAGNILDMAVEQHKQDLWGVVERVLQQPFAVDDGTAFRQALGHVNLPTASGGASGGRILLRQQRPVTVRGGGFRERERSQEKADATPAESGAASRLFPVKQILYLADNTGETVFDRVLIETLDLPVIYAVKEGPILNDATREDAIAAGLDQVAKIVSTGSDAPGTILARCSESFQQLYNQAKLIIAKGQANYETLSAGGPRVFFLLQAKCPVIAGDLGVPLRSIILKQGSGLNTPQ